MGFYTATATDWLALLFKATAIADIADNDATTPDTVIDCALHTADPGTGGTLATNEVGYTSYARQSIARSGAGFTVTGAVLNPAADITFPVGTGGSGTVTHISFGKTGGGATNGFFSGTATPNVVTGSGYQPVVKSTTTLTLT